MTACRDCQNWAEPSGNPEDSYTSASCRRRAPTVRLDDVFRPIYPMTKAAHWCGEFKAKEAQPEPEGSQPESLAAWATFSDGKRHKLVPECWCKPTHHPALFGGVGFWQHHMNREPIQPTKSERPLTDWIEWTGGKMPVPGDALVQVERYYGQEIQRADMLVWNRLNHSSDILRYRVIGSGT